jgi:hypothetical protein
MIFECFSKAAKIASKLFKTSALLLNKRENQRRACPVNKVPTNSTCDY